MTNKSAADVEGFIDMLRAACEEPAMRATLLRILQPSPQQRHDLVHLLVNDLRNQGAPTSLIEAIACLIDDDIATRAIELLQIKQ